MSEVEQAQVYAQIISSSFSDEGRFLIDKEGVVLLSNDKHIPFSIEKKQNLLTYFSPFIPEISIGKIQELAFDSSGYETNFNIQNNDGVCSFYRVLFTLITMDSNVVILVQVQDITKNKEIETQHSRQLARMENEMILRTQEIMHTRDIIKNQGGYLRNFLRGLKHDLKSPVTQLKEIIQYYKTTENPKKKMQAAELIDNCLDKLSNTARGFSDFVDLHFQSKEQLEICYFDPIFQDVQLLLKAETDIAGALIQTDFTEGNRIYFNKKELTSIVYNILSNAIKFRKLDDPLEIKIRTTLSSNKLLLIISDNGIGMDLEKYRALLFVPFKRLNMDRSGAGIGLSLVKNILERNNAAIDIESKPDLGTTINIQFSTVDL